MIAHLFIFTKKLTGEANVRNVAHPFSSLCLFLFFHSERKMRTCFLWYLWADQRHLYEIQAQTNSTPSVMTSLFGLLTSVILTLQAKKWFTKLWHCLYWKELLRGTTLVFLLMGRLALENHTRKFLNTILTGLLFNVKYEKRLYYVLAIKMY